MPDVSYRSSLPAPPDHFGGTGAVELVPDPRDFTPCDHPKVRDILNAGAPGSADRSRGVCEILNQGQTGACVAHSTPHGIQLDNNLDRGICYHFDAMTLYHEMGGTGANGVDSRGTLQRCVDVGAPLVGGGRVKIGSYFRVDSIAGTFTEQIKAAVASGQVAVIALLLPSTFGGRWSSGSVTSGYHQVCICGYSGDLFWGPNSWGSGWGGGNHPAGFYELSFSYCEANNFQGGYCYSFFYDPAEVHTPIPDPQPNPNPQPQPQPQPTPAKRYVVTAKATGQGMDTLATGTLLGASGGGFSGNLSLTGVTVYDDPTPNPNPQPDPQPQPNPDPGGLKVDALVHGAGLYVTVRDASGAFVGASVKAMVGDVELMAFNKHTGAGISATFLIGRNHGTAVVLATTDDGRSATGNAQV